MRTFILKKMLILIMMLLIITFMIFVGIELTPGDVVSYMIPPQLLAEITQDQLNAIRDKLGLNDPFIIRYFRWLWDIIRGNFGYSLTSGQPAINEFLRKLPATLELSFTALILSSLFGIALGIVSALKKGTITDTVVSFAGMVGVSIPHFFFGIIMIYVFAIKLRWFPTGGRSMPGYDSFFDTLPHLILPAIVLSIALTAAVMRYTRASMLDAIGKEYMKTARGKGLSKWRVTIVHGLRSSITPVIVLLGFRFPIIVAGTTVIETVFSRPGIGSLFITSIRSYNYPVTMMIALFITLLVLISSFMMDVLAALIDPRIRLR